MFQDKFRKELLKKQCNVKETFRVGQVIRVSIKDVTHKKTYHDAMVKKVKKDNIVINWYNSKSKYNETIDVIDFRDRIENFYFGYVFV